MTLRRVIAVVAVLAITLGVIALISGACFLYWLPIPARMEPGEKRALAQYFHGHELFDAGEYEKAAHEYMAWERWEEDHGEDSSETKGLIGHSLDLAGHPDEGLARIEQSLAANRRWYVCIYKASFIARRKSPEAAVAWLEGLDFDPMTRAHMIGTYHKERAEFGSALPYLQKWFELAGGREFRFDASHQVEMPRGPIAAENADGIRSLLEPLEDLAETHLALEDFDEAYRYATMGVSIGRIMHDDARSYAGDRYADAGSVACRIVRTEVLIKRKRYDEARDEITYAAAIAEWGKYSGHLKAVDKARADLDQSIRR
jgi:tetratricopeptide (TPR) repeat protein